eukprot:TRINITY_DN12289_c0_g1_i1.p1 TRINITY_DN12289_c0_g1~~TRINITY_DN12289_c0_g1_i1.p1  ORF type:complete len:200 (-),score=37.77 TRINITY_DN12289_c0_g1_i1:522-1121(-)
MLRSLVGSEMCIRDRSTGVVEFNGMALPLPGRVRLVPPMPGYVECGNMFFVNGVSHRNSAMLIERRQMAASPTAQDSLANCSTPIAAAVPTQLAPRTNSTRDHRPAGFLDITGRGTPQDTELQAEEEVCRLAAEETSADGDPNPNPTSAEGFISRPDSAMSQDLYMINGIVPTRWSKVPRPGTPRFVFARAEPACGADE